MADTMTTKMTDVRGDSYRSDTLLYSYALKDGNLLFSNLDLYLYSFYNYSVIYTVNINNVVVGYGNFTNYQHLFFNVSAAGLSTINIRIAEDEYNYTVRILQGTYEEYAGLSRIEPVPTVSTSVMLGKQIQTFLGVIAGIGICFVWIGWLPPFQRIRKLNQDIQRLV
jgi:hypothetical protein